MPGAKKVVIIKNQFFHKRQPREGMAAIIPGDKIFDLKLVSIVFTTCRIGISGLILNLRAMGLT